MRVGCAQLEDTFLDFAQGDDADEKGSPRPARRATRSRSGWVRLCVLKDQRRYQASQLRQVDVPTVSTALDVQVFGPELGLQQGRSKAPRTAPWASAPFLGEHDRRRLAVDSHRLRIAARGPLDELAETAKRAVPFVEASCSPGFLVRLVRVAWTHHAWL